MRGSSVSSADAPPPPPFYVTAGGRHSDRVCNRGWLAGWLVPGCLAGHARVLTTPPGYTALTQPTAAGLQILL
jgi:hypothetical protein